MVNFLKRSKLKGPSLCSFIFLFTILSKSQSVPVDVSHQFPSQPHQPFNGGGIHFHHHPPMQSCEHCHFKNPDFEGFERLNSNHPNPARRHVRSFYSEPQHLRHSGNQGGGQNFYHENFEHARYPRQNQNPPIFRHQQMPPSSSRYDDFPDPQYRKPDPGQNHHRTQRFAQESPVPPPPRPPIFNNLHKEEGNFPKPATDFKHKPQENILKKNEPFFERNSIPDSFNPDNVAPSHRLYQEEAKYNQQNHSHIHISTPSFAEPSSPSQNAPQRKSNTLQLKLSPPQPKAISLLFHGPNGNSTLFIEYDVSDKDVTYETTVEVEDNTSDHA